MTVEAETLATKPVANRPLARTLADQGRGFGRGRVWGLLLVDVLAVWIAIASVIASLHWSVWGGLALNAVAFAICTPLMQRYRHAKMPPIARRWYDVPLRASLVAVLIAAVVTLSGRVGPSVSGVLG